MADSSLGKRASEERETLERSEALNESSRSSLPADK